MRFENDESSSHPMVIEVAPGTYHWCQCGKTKNVPYCDGSHVGTDITPLTFEIAEAGQVAICNCGLTGNPPYCDGAHVEL